MPTPAYDTLPLDEQIARFMEHVEKTATCWLWTSCKSKNGYGYSIVGQRSYQAHRRAYALLVGPIPTGKWILHSCDVRHCVNPAHLRPGNAKDNGADMVERRRARCADVERCANGHPFTPENTATSIQRGRTRRHCRICRREARRRHEGYTGARRWPAASPNSSLRIR